MPSDIAIPDDSTKHLNAPAVAELKAVTSRYVEDVLREANRLEAVLKSTAGTPEVTSSMVRDADMLLRRGYSKPRKSRLVISAQLVATTGGFVVGFFTDADKLKNPEMLVLFVVTLAVTITATVIGIMKD